MIRIILSLAMLAALAFVPASAQSIFADGFDGPQVVGCPATIQTPAGARRLVKNAAISYGVYQRQRLGVNIGEWTELLGYNDAVAPTPEPWPGVGGAAPVIRVFPRGAYFGAHFRTAATGPLRNGSFSNPSYVAGPNVIMAISTQCGDFTEHLPTPGCIAYGETPWDGVPTADGNLVQWKETANAPGSWCNIRQGSDYYLNVMFADDATDCPLPSANCAIGVVSYHN